MTESDPYKGDTICHPQVSTVVLGTINQKYMEKSMNIRIFYSGTAVDTYTETPYSVHKYKFRHNPTTLPRATCDLHVTR